MDNNNLLLITKLNAEKSNLKASPDGNATLGQIAFALAYGYDRKFAMTLGTSEKYWTKEFVANKWYKVSSPRFFLILKCISDRH